MFRSTVLLAVLSVLTCAGQVAAGVTAASYSPTDTIPWDDPGFETTTDFSTGPWEIGKVSEQLGQNKNWDFSVLVAGGIPGRFVRITDPTGGAVGITLLGQHLTIPQTSEVISVGVSADITKYCDHAQRGGGMGFLLLPASEWNRMDVGLPGAQTTTWGSVGRYLEIWEYQPPTPDLLTWTHVELGLDNRDTLRDLLNSHKGEDLVLATAFWGWHGGAYNEHFSLDNFSATITTIPEPSTFILLTIGAVGLLAYARRRR